MKLHPVLASLPLLAIVAAPVSAHGGSYRGPGDNQPSGAGASSSGGTSAARSTTGAARVPTAGGTRPQVAAPGQSAGGPSAGAATASAPDLTVWQLWWGYNQAEFVDLKGAIHAGALEVDSDEFFLRGVSVEHTRDRLVPHQARVREEIVPGLLRVLADERDADLVTGALIALAKIGDAPGGAGASARAIRPFLSDGNQEIAETAAVSLGILAAPSSVQPLVDLLEDTPRGRALVERPAGVPWRTRAFAAYGLGLTGHRQDDPVLRAEIVRSLVTSASSAEHFATPDIEVACVNALSLVALPRQTDLTRVERGVESLEGQVAWLASIAADTRRDDALRGHAPVAAARLLAPLPGDDPLVARTASRWVAALGKNDGPRQLEQGLVLALGDLGRSGDGELERAIRARLERVAESGKSSEARHFALVALARGAARPAAGAGASGASTAAVRASLLQRLERGSSTERPWAALALGVLASDLGSRDEAASRAVGRALAEALDDARAPREVGAYSIALGMLRERAAAGILIRTLEEVRDDETRGYVALALGMVGAVESLDRIRDVVRESRYRPELLRQAAIALGLLGDKRLVPELIAMLKAQASLSGQASLAQALGAIGDSRSITPLVEMLADVDVTPRARAFAAVALGLVADKEPQPWNAKLAAGIQYRAQTVTLTDGNGAGILEIL